MIDISDGSVVLRKVEHEIISVLVFEAQRFVRAVPRAAGGSFRTVGGDGGYGDVSRSSGRGVRGQHLGFDNLHRGFGAEIAQQGARHQE